MGFLENDGDIILDAVLTDAGRERLARGDASFQITKFSFGDDEINYGLYNRTHASGSAYYDLEILQTPVFEAITDNGAVLKHKLITIPRSDLLYLPIVKLNEDSNFARRTGASAGFNGTFVVFTNADTEDSFKSENGIMFGNTSTSNNVFIRIDQGLDTTEISANRALDDSLIETRYTIEIDNRFGEILSEKGKTRARPSYIDDDNIASYNFSLGSDLDFVTELPNDSSGQVIRGPKGTSIVFQIRASLELNSSTYYFTTLGSTGSITDKDALSLSVSYIDTLIRVRGATTGRTVDIPIRYIKK
jgi:hypothetical protein